jgi:hypothetical protein
MGHKWLIHATHALEQGWKMWKEMNQSSPSRESRLYIEYIETSLQIFTRYHTFADTNLNITLNITSEKTKITYIPRSVKAFMKPLLRSSLAYGVNITLPQTESFLIREYGYTSEEFTRGQSPIQQKTKITQAEYHPGTIKPGTVILTTSQKHARDLGQVLRKIHGSNVEILIQ